jgi:cell division protein YceG involved in septum cleavage
MAHRPGPERKLSMKSRLIIIAIMFVIINLVFYFGFDSSDESEDTVGLDNETQLDIEKNTELKQELEILINP